MIVNSNKMGITSTTWEMITSLILSDTNTDFKRISKRNLSLHDQFSSLDLCLPPRQKMSSTIIFLKVNGSSGRIVFSNAGKRSLIFFVISPQSGCFRNLNKWDITQLNRPKIKKPFGITIIQNLYFYCIIRVKLIYYQHVHEISQR